MTESGQPERVIELPMQVVCSVCKKVIRETTARWPESDVKRAERLPSWKGIVVSHSYCDEHIPVAEE